MKIILKPYYQEDDCPAYIIRANNCCIIYCNEYLKDKYDTTQWKFWISHEAGHFFLDTNSEYKADEFALKTIFNKEPYSLKKSLLALKKLNLPNDRLDKLFNIAFELDKKK